MASATQPAEVLEREFLVLRGRLLDVAATLDRLDRAGGPPPEDPRTDQLRRSLEILASPGPRTDRAEQIQLIFSLPYNPHWRT